MEQKILDFAKDELTRFQSKSNDSRLISFNINPVLSCDSYQIDVSNQDAQIQASGARGILYGVYEYAKGYLGYDFSTLGQEVLAKSSAEVHQSHTPRFTRRGNIFEVINDTNYLLEQIDINGKYGHNEMFFTFFLFDEVSEVVLDALEKRGISVTLGGHSLKYLLEPLLDLKKDEAENLSFYKDETLMAYVINKVVEICTKHPVVKRISLWPQDIGIPQSKGLEFMQLYIDFNHAMKKALIQNNLDVAVEFIVYNAGLNTEMLYFYDDLVLYDNLDILYAYWGRDYSQTFDNKEALEALKSWIKVADVTVLEYYSDFYMMSELYPPLNYRITSDLDFYKSLGVKGVLNLLVPLLKSRTSHRYQYDYQRYHQRNNLVYSECLWTKGDALVSDLEKMLSRLTRFNQKLFPKRLVDLELEPSVRLELKAIDAGLDTEDVYQSKLKEVIEVILDE